MRLNEILEQAAIRGAARFLEKRGMAPALITTALQTPGFARRASERYHAMTDQLDQAATATPPKLSSWGTQMLQGAAKVKPEMPGSAKGFALNLAGGAAASALGTVGASLLQDIMSKAKSSIGSIGQDSARKAILDQLKREDMVLQQADDKVLMEAYHSMVRFAPTLSTDKNAVRSFLRQAVMTASGPDYMSIKLLADAERAVTGKGKDH